MRRFVLGTAGHVDHGKTTLVQALTGIDTDRLPEEKRRGITIELGFAPWSIDDDTQVSIVDVPGHRRLVHTMIAGAAGIELVLLVVAADEGVMPQTREHLAACELLGIRRAVVAITKLDRVERELAEMAAAEVAELCAGRFESELVLCSAKTGEGLPELTAAVRRALLATVAPAASPQAQLSVDRVFSVKGAGTVVTGTLVRGTLQVGGPVVVVSGTERLQTSVRGLHVHDRAVKSADAPTRLAVNLGKGSVEEIGRGAALSTDPAFGASRVLDVDLRFLRQVKNGASLEAYVGTARSPARLRIFREATEEVPTALCRVALTQPLAVTGDDRIILRSSSTRGPSGAVVAGGRVIDARPPPARRRALRIASLEATSLREPLGILRALAAELAPKPVLPAHLAARLPLEASVLVRAAEKLVEKGELVRTKPEGWVARAAVNKLATKARAVVAAHHEAHPIDRGMGLETLRQKLGVGASPGVAEEAIRVAARKGAEDPLIVEGDVVRLLRFDPDAPSSAIGPLEAGKRALRSSALKGVTEHQFSEAMGTSGRELRAAITRLVREGHADAVGGMWFERAAVDDLRVRVIAELESKGVLTIAAFKDLSGLGRKQAIPLLEMLDREGTTKRVGDDRAPGPGRR